jgi:hypothetical protein
MLMGAGIPVLLVGLLSTPALADTWCNAPVNWEGPNAGCKYAKVAPASTTCGSNGCNLSKVITTLRWRGGTASGSYDPSNDIVRWRLVSINIVRASDGYIRWSLGTQPWHNNGDPDAATYSVNPNVTVGSNTNILFTFYWESSYGPHSFYGYVTREVYVNCFTECQGGAEEDIFVEYPFPEHQDVVFDLCYDSRFRENCDDLP